MKKPDYAVLGQMLQSLTAGTEDVVANLANASALLMAELPGLNWAGFYRLGGDGLILGPFQGKPACIAIPMGKGVCGTAAAQGQTIRVPDVHAFPGHIACDSASRSELVIPLRRGGKLWGVLDLDSPEAGHFTPEDQAGLEAIARILEGVLEAGSAY